jgi:hypothetical protein
VKTIYPVIPISEGHALSVGVLSYNGYLHLSGYADPDALPEATELRSLLPAAFTELASAVGRGSSMSASMRRGAPPESQASDS